jgi:iron complex outermembrane receptor protein
MILAGTAICSSLVLTANASAQSNAGNDVIEEIFVTATKRSSTIQDVPFSINAQSQKDMQRSGAQNLEDVARNVAGLMIQNLGPGQSQVAIRGVSAGQIIRDQPGVKEQVGVYLDESVISLSLFTPDLDLYDLNRVEVLRGPQGTLFGSGSVGGTVRYITNQPDADAFESSAEFNLNTIKDGSVGGSLKSMVNVPLADDKSALRLVVYTTKYGGFIDAHREGGGIDKDVNSGSRSGGRIAIKMAPSDNLSITPRIIYQKILMDGFNRQETFNLFANPHTTTREAVQLGPREQHLLVREQFDDKTFIADLNIVANFDNFDITSVSSYTDRDILVSRDASALTGSVSVDLGYNNLAVTLPSNLRDTTKVEQFTQELRLSSNNDGPAQWVFGGFYSKTDRFYKQFLPTPGYDAFTDDALGAGTAVATSAGVGPADSPFYSELPYNLEQIAIFAEASYDLTDKLNLTVGGRYYDYTEERSVTQVGLFGNGVVNQIDKTTANGFTPRVLASYDVTDAVTFNGQISKGFRLGGVNDPLNTALCDADDLAIFGGFQDYNDETLWNYEVGVKIKTDNMSLNAAYFYSDISDLQVTLDAGSCSSRISFNVPESHSQGIEFELKTSASSFDFSLAGALLDSTFDTTVINSQGDVLGGVRKGNRLPSVPEFNLGLTTSYNFQVGQKSDGYISATFQHRSSIYTQPSDQEDGAGTFSSGLAFGGATGAEVTELDLELDGYQSVNISAGLLSGNWEFVAYISNLTDENANLSFDRERGGRARLGFRTNQPRTIGLTARANF